MLMLANLFWAGNVVLGRGIAGVVPPIALAYWRWTGAFLVAVGFAWPYLKQDAPVLLRHWRMMLLLSATGIASYNTMSYIGLTSTTALNVLLLQSAGPLIIIVWAFALFGDRPTLWQSAGVLLSLTGVAIIAANGSLERLLHLSLNRGDVWVLAAMVIYGVYAAVFRVRPATHALSFLVATMGVGSLMILPFYLWEIAQGGHIVAGLPAWLTRNQPVHAGHFVCFVAVRRFRTLPLSGRCGRVTPPAPWGSALPCIRAWRVERRDAWS